MSLKSSSRVPSREERKIAKEKQPRSLRWQLMLWYGGLLAVSLTLFASLVLFLSTQTLYGNVDHTLNAVVRVTLNNIKQELAPQAPYWPASLALKTIDIYKEPGVNIAVLDQQGYYHYVSSSTFSTVLVDKTTIQGVQTTGKPGEYIKTVEGERIKVEVEPVYAPNNGTVIGVLLVTKSLQEVDETVVGLHALIISLGLGVLIVTLGGGWAMTANVLRPLAALTRTARTIVSTVHGTHVGSLSQRVQRPQGHDEMVQVVDTFNEMLDSLEGATKAQRRFIADASHELRAPLTTIQGNLAFLQRYQDEIPLAERRTVLGDAYEETLRLARLVDELLLLARADASKDTTALPDPEKSDAGQERVEAGTRDLIELDRTLLQLVRQLRGRLSLDKSQVKLEVGHIEPVRVRGDEESVRRILLILLDNALKYTPGDSENGAGLITVSLERKLKAAIVHVQDTGIGIDSADLPHIFERFYRADHTRSRHGTGLGLAIARTLAEQLGGGITAQSTTGKGSTFSVWLPLA
jgi:two-component system, OmpR family, sensor kinase